MPEIMSAGKACETIDDIFCECTGYNGRCAPKEVEAFISSRDSAIIEKCKKALIGCLSGTGNLGVCQMALDSVLSDINGGK
jgi:hypothetical protein